MPESTRSASFRWILLVYVFACGVTWLVMAAYPVGSVRGLVSATD